MTILAFIQNQWHRDPEKVRRMIAECRRGSERRKLRRRLIAHSLFAGCKSGKVLTRGLGESLIREIVWEESSKDIGSHASSVFPADLAHIAECYEELQPDIVLGFGRIAGDALIALREEYQIPERVKFLSAPHPAARHAGVEREIALMAMEIKNLQFRMSAPTEVDFG